MGVSKSGKIASIGDAAFSLEVTSGQERKTIEFLVDDDTKVEGLAPKPLWSIALQMAGTSLFTSLSSLHLVSREW